MSIEHEQFGDEIICPYCEEEFSDSWEYEQYEEIECYECNKTFSSNRIIDVSYATNKDCELNGEEHDWCTDKSLNHCLGNVSEHDGSVYHQCRKCGMTKYIKVQ